MRGSLQVRGGRDVHGVPRDVMVVDGRVVDGSTPASDAPVLDATGLVVAPGLVDLQVNGACGVDVTAHPERLWEVAAALPAYGVTSFLPTVITAAPEQRQRALATLRDAQERRGARPLGLHLEGPMLAPERKGAHPDRWLRAPDERLVDRWSREAGVVVVTVAPELPDASEVIRSLVGRGVVVSIGHTSATTTQVEAAIRAGASCVTHLFNAMPPLGHREPGPVGTALGDDRLVAGVIADGHHVDPLTLRVAWRCLGPDRFLAVSDTTAALGLPDGATLLGEQDVVVAEGTVRLPDGTLAGSAASLLDCVGVLLRTTGCTLADAITTATTTPARVLGDRRLGRLDDGCHGDLVLLDHDPASDRLDLVASVVAGRVCHDVREVG
jgi:N-acetylglucosamine-6-phosphate deacetylase